MQQSERIARITKAADAAHEAYGDLMDLYAAVNRRLDAAELEKIGAVWRRLSSITRILRELELDATLER